jgi:hypothetical protein
VPSKSSLTIEQVLTLLAETPRRIATLTAGLGSSQFRAAPDDDGWSANDVLAHLRACADIWGNCMITIATQDKPTLRAVNPRTWIKKTNYREQEFQPSLQTFASQRANLLEVIEPLAHEDWLHTAIVTGAGKVLERNVLFYGRWLAIHERQHMKQLEHLLNAIHM